ncbi:MAG: hypothetical protein AABY49_03290 [Planctomycetota bacterium]
MEKIINGNRTVAFLDILGFGQMVDSIPLDELSKKYEKLIDKLEYLIWPLDKTKNHPTLFPEHQHYSPWCIKNIYSDSIILISLDESLMSCLKLLIYSWRLTQVCLSAQMPVRGAITFGEIYINQNKNITLGKALTDAHKLEREQQWIGVSINDNMEKSLPELFQKIRDIPILSNIFLKYEVPFKDKPKKLLHTLNWRWNVVIEKGTRSLFSNSKDQSIKEKVANTLDYAKSVVDSGQIYVKDQGNLPTELRSFFVGDSEPPFTHGDDL